jgi:hypothetical protein
LGEAVASNASKGKAAVGNGANLRYGCQLSQTADVLRNHSDAAEYNRVVHGLNSLRDLYGTPLAGNATAASRRAA